MRRLPAPRTLRARVLLAALTLVLIALGTVNVVAWLTVRDGVQDAVDSQLRSVPTGLSPPPKPGTTPEPPGTDTAPQPGPAVTDPAQGANSDLLSNLVVTALDARTGKQVYEVIGPSQQGAPKPDLVSVARKIRAGEVRDELLTVPSLDDGGYEYRVRVLPGSGPVVVIATSMASSHATVRRVVLLDAAVSALVVLALLGVGLVVIRIGLRPLADVEEAADRLAAGDLTARVGHAEERSEVGRLARSFNRMVEQIEEAFRARDAGEQKLRAFLADASHELRTPLTSIRAYAELFGRQVLEVPPESATALSRIESEAKRMGRLVDDLLVLARLDQQHPQVLEPVPLGPLVEHAVQDVAATAPEHRLVLDRSPGAEEATVQADEAGLTQVVVNLLGNAVQHTPAGSTVTVSLRQDGDTVVLEVADDGPGMTPDVAARVFDRFFRPEAGRSRATGARSGTGLGLAIVQSQVEAHGGTVELDTAPGRGARFVVRLPAAPAAVRSEAHSSLR